jgi:hypothetical protein
MSSSASQSETSLRDDEMEISSDDSRKLFRLNLGLGIFHLATGSALIALTDTDATAPVYSFFSDPDTRGIADAWVPIANLLGTMPVGYWAGISILISSLDHLLVATLFRNSYEHYLARFHNPFRWIEYGFSASCMHVMVAQLSGVFSVHLLFSIFGFTMVTMIFGNEQELANAKRRYVDGNREDEKEQITLRPFWYGCIPHLYGWALIFWFFFQGVSNSDAPAFVWVIIFAIFILDCTFPINQYLQQKRIGKWDKYVYGEIWFCILSLVAKQLLAWVNFGGTMALSSEMDDDAAA